MRYTYFKLSFFNFILNTFGVFTVLMLKKWIHNNKDLIKIKARNKYLLHCKRSNLVPKHLLKYITHYPKFYNDFSTRRATFHSHRFVRLILNLEIRDNFKQLKVITSNIYRLTRTIENNLPSYICNQFFTTQHMSLKKFFVKEKIRLNNKLDWCSSNNYLYFHNNNIVDKIKNINYVYVNGDSNSQNDFRVSLHGSSDSTIACSNSVLSVNIEPSKYEFTENTVECLGKNGSLTLVMFPFLTS